MGFWFNSCAHRATVIMSFGNVIKKTAKFQQIRSSSLKLILTFEGLFLNSKTIVTHKVTRSQNNLLMLRVQ